MGLFDKKKKDETNKENNLNPFAKTVDNKSNELNSDGTPKAEPPATPPADKPFDAAKFYKDGGLYEGIDVGGMMKAAADGNEDAFGAGLAKMMENSVSFALSNAAKITDAKVSAARESVVSETKSTAEMDLAIKAMNAALPATANEAVAPNANNVLKGFIDQGQSTDEAVESTKAYFEEVSTQMATEMGMKVINPNDTKGFTNSQMLDQHNENNNLNGNSDDTDWVDTLTGGAETAESLQAKNEPKPAAE